MGTAFAGGLLRCGAAATRYCAAADCGSSRMQPFPHQTATPHRVRAAHEGNRPFAVSHALHPIPQNRVRGQVGLVQCFPRYIKGSFDADNFPDDPLQRRDLIHPAQFDRLFGHAEYNAGFFILRDGVTAHFVHFM